MGEFPTIPHKRRMCPKCGSTMLMGRHGRLCCQRCKHVGLKATFPWNVQ